MKARFAAVATLIFSIILPLESLFALEIPPLLGRVNDYAHMISPPVRQQLEEKLAALEQSDSTQIVILTVTDLQGVAIEEYSMEVAKKWRIGQKTLNNGVIFLVAKENRKMRIEVGYGLEGRLTDILAGRILDNEVRPHFKAENYDEGFMRGVDGIIQAVRGEYRASHVPRHRQLPRGVSGKMDTLIIIGWIILIPALIVIGFRKFIAAVITGAIVTPLLMIANQPFDIGLLIAYGILGAITGFILGILGHTFASSGGSSGYSGYSSDDSWSSSSSYSSSSDSFSGGGGDFGGGGASSDW